MFLVLYQVATRSHVVQMSDMANNDLEKYGKALDKCVFIPSSGLTPDLTPS